MKKDLWNGYTYKKNSSPQKLSADNFLKIIKFKKNENILDLGCGDGKITLSIAKKHPFSNILGIDLSPSMIEEAKKLKLKNLNFKIQNINNINFENSFDTILSFSTFHWIEDQCLVLKKIKKALKEQGKLYICVLTKNIGIPIEDLYIQKKWIKYFKNKKTNFFLKEKNIYLKILKDLNFQKIKITERTTNYLFNNLKDLLNYIFPWIPPFTNLPKNKCLEFAKDLALYTYNYHNKKENQPLLIKFPVLKIEAQKIHKLNKKRFSTKDKIF